MKYLIEKLFEALKAANLPVVKCYEDGSIDFSRELTKEEDAKVSELLQDETYHQKGEASGNNDEVPGDEKKFTRTAPVDYGHIAKSVVELLKAEPALKAAPTVKKIPVLDKDEETNAFLYWVKTGKSAGPYKAAMQEGTTTEGGYLVPDDFLGRIIAKRDEASIMRGLGAQVIQTSRDKVDIPTANGDVTPAVSAEEAAYTESEPTVAQVQIEIHKVTDLIKLSEELEEDEAANLGGFLSNHVGAMFAAWENDAFFVGTGSSEPDGVFQSGTAGLTSDFATTIASSEIPELFFILAAEYRDSPQCAWAMKDSTAALIYGLTGNVFQFMPTPQGQLAMQLMGKPVKTSAKIAAHTAALKSIVIGDFSYYMIAERRSIRVMRNPYLYQGNGQVGLFWSQRVGGAVLQAEAFQYMTAHS